MDTRVLKKMAKWLAYGLASISGFMAIALAGQKLFDASPDTVVNCMVAAFGLYMLYGLAKARVDMERNEEQRLIDKLARHNAEEYK